MTSRLSAEGQHLIDALEAHMVAVKAAALQGSEALIASVEDAWDHVLEHLDATEAKFRGEAIGAAENGAWAGDVASQAGATQASEAGAGVATAGETRDIGTLVSENAAKSADDDTPRA